HGPGAARSEIHIPEVELLIAEEELRSVGRPPESIIKGIALPEGNPAHGARTVLRADGQIVLPGLIGEVGDGLAVGRPGRLTVHRAGTVGEVLDAALPGRHR